MTKKKIPILNEEQTRVNLFLDIIKQEKQTIQKFDAVNKLINTVTV